MQRTIILGSSTLTVSRLGLGCVGMSESYGSPNDAHSIKTLEQAIDLGINFFDTADAYGAGHNEKLLASVLKENRSKMIVATKCGFIRHSTDDDWSTVCGHPDYIKKACAASLERLGIETIDLYYLHRPDPQVPIEDSMHAMAQLVKEGKIRYVGLSEVDAETLKRAHAVYPVTALQSEYSLWWRQPEEDIFSVCKDLGITFVAFSPLGRGFLSGKIDPYLLESKDARRTMPRFFNNNFAINRKWLEPLEEMAAQKNCSAAQLALAWMLNKSPDLVSIPGTKKVALLHENIKSLEIELSASDIANIETGLPLNLIAGNRI